MLYTSNAIESLNIQICEVIKTRGRFPSDETTGKLLYLALRNNGKKWNAMPDRYWRAASCISSSSSANDSSRRRNPMLTTHTQNS